MRTGPPIRIAIVACLEFLDMDDDWPVLHAALLAAGATPSLVAWDDPAVEWSTFDRAVIRATWDSTVRPQEYLAWARRVDRLADLVNPLAVIEWNLDKRYLAALADEGFATVPTQWVDPGEGWTMLEGEVVVKPSISGGGMDTARYGAADLEAARVHVRDLHVAGRTVMVQPYLAAVDDEGELSLVYVDGALSHVVRKGPLLDLGAGVDNELWKRFSISGARPSPAHLAVGEQVLVHLSERFGACPVYCRVDLVSGPNGDPLVLEVELIDPSLFLHLSPGSADRLAAAVTR